MNKFNIRDIESITGIKAATLRIWEQRYGIIIPKRTDSNIRFYDDNDLKLLLNISILLKNGFRISDIAALSPTDLTNKVIKVAESTSKDETVWQALTMSMLQLNENAFEKIISKAILQQGMEQTMLRILLPFFNNLGLMWQTGSINPAHEHFITNIIRQKLLVAIDGQINKIDSFSKKYLLFLPQNEFHEIGLLFANYVLRSRGHQVIYLGQNVPYEDLKVVANIYNPDFLFCVITAPLVELPVDKYITRLVTDFSDLKVYISGQSALQYSENLHFSNLQFFKTFEEMTVICSEIN